MFCHSTKRFLFGTIVAFCIGVLTTNALQTKSEPITSKPNATSASQPTDIGTTHAAWRKRVIESVGSQLNSSTEYNLHFQELGEDTRILLRPRGETVLDGAIELIFSKDYKVKTARGLSTSQPAVHKNDKVSIAEPIIIPLEKMVNPLDFRVIDLALKEARESLEQGAAYNVDFYYGFRGLPGERGVVVSFDPVELDTSPRVNVSLAISIEEPE